MSLAQFNAQLNESFAQLNKTISGFFNFITYRIKNFSRLSIGEQISFSAIGLGLVLIIASMVLFMI